MSEEEERELADADAEFQDKNPDTERNQRILIALGFTPHYHDKDKEGNDETNFGIRVMNTKIGVKFNDANPAGKVWAYVLTEDNKKDFIKNGDLKQLPLVQRYLDILAAKKPIPETMVTGRIIERRGKGILIEIEEDREKKEIFFGLGAVKRHNDGSHFIPCGFSKPSSDNPDGKMSVPRDILLPGMDPQAEAEEKPASREEAEAQRIREEQGRAPAATTIPTPAAEAAPAQPPSAKPTPVTDDEKISYYVNLIGKITKKVKAEERISPGERGYAISKAFDAITRDRRSELIAELKIGERTEEE